MVQSRPVLRIAVASLASAGIACTAAPAAEQLQLIAPGVRVFGTHVGGLTLDPARLRLQAAAPRPISIVYRREVLHVSPNALGMRASVDHVLRRALSARPHARLELSVAYSSASVDRYVDRLAHRYNRAPRPAKVIGATEHAPLIRDGKVGLAVEK